MKLRFFGSSIRFRVRKQDIRMLVSDGFVEKSVRVGPMPEDVLAYRLEVIEDASWVLRPLSRGLAVCIPQALANQWADSAEVGLSFTAPWGVRVLIEKDFPCLEPSSGESDEGTFARPAGEPVQCTANE